MFLYPLPHDSAVKISTKVHSRVLPRTTLFIHGNLASNNWWRPSLAEWEKKKDRRSSASGAMILAEFRGCGQSSPPRGPEDVDMDLFADDMIAVAEAAMAGAFGEALPGPYNLVGHSTGGLICALMAVRRPDLFERIVLLDPVGARGVVFDDSMLEAFEQMKRSQELTAQVIGSTIKDLDPKDPFFTGKIVPDAYHAVQTTGPWVLMALRDFDARDRLRSNRCHGLVLHGEHDTLLPMEDSKELAALLRARFEVIPGQGHCCNVEAPGKFVALADDFLFNS